MVSHCMFKGRTRNASYSIGKLQAHLWSTCNAAKTHVMVHGSKEPVLLGGKQIDQEESFRYLGSMVGNDGDSTPEICTRLAVARETKGQLIGIWTAKEIRERERKKERFK